MKTEKVKIKLSQGLFWYKNGDKLEAIDLVPEDGENSNNQEILVYINKKNKIDKIEIKVKRK